jgi:hypothetical protein
MMRRRPASMQGLLGKPCSDDEDPHVSDLTRLSTLHVTSGHQNCGSFSKGAYSDRQAIVWQSDRRTKMHLRCTRAAQAGLIP